MGSEREVGGSSSRWDPFVGTPSPNLTSHNQNHLAEGGKRIIVFTDEEFSTIFSNEVGAGGGERKEGD